MVLNEVGEKGKKRFFRAVLSTVISLDSKFSGKSLETLTMAANDQIIHGRERSLWLLYRGSMGQN